MSLKESSLFFFFSFSGDKYRVLRLNFSRSTGSVPLFLWSQSFLEPFPFFFSPPGPEVSEKSDQDVPVPTTHLNDTPLPPGLRPSESVFTFGPWGPSCRPSTSFFRSFSLCGRIRWGSGGPLASRRDPFFHFSSVNFTSEVLYRVVLYRKFGSLFLLLQVLSPSR